ncbi:hypothetical protein FNV43_RR18907 [Rhamnella rubrinervis]|uniref:Uncharacterized protein n=1 Tax=Rhamnella rubrinervis TaxID=2594499 RepID=A0A8K0GWS8_9ROSA|nr:hypothetical protein FNV43_RR18907 [Rhamnella rubrinervis]
MPVNDPRAGRAFVWLVASLLFVSVAVGGGCLITYMVLPESHHTSSWLPVVGVTLVCLPWLFWFLTFVYRIVSRVFGFRVGIGSGGGVVDDHHHHRGNTSNNNVNEGGNVNDDDHQPPLGSTGDQLQFGAAGMMMNQQDHRGHGHDDDDDHHGKNKYSRSSSNSSNVSHESEMPLALSMAS